MLLGINADLNGVALLSRIVDARPPARAHISTLSKIGYDFNSAVSDIIDNSITANARNIQIKFNKNGSDAVELFIIDDGDGMSESELIENMSIGCKDPQDNRAPGDLGRFGSGLKTASFSQAEILTVITKNINSDLAAAIWDKDVVRKTNRWDLKVLDGHEISSFLPREHKSFEKGTIVRWDKLASIQSLSHSHEAQEQINTLTAELHSHVGLFFHRFLADKNYLKIKINGRDVKEIDPFMIRLPGSEELQNATFRTGPDRNKDKVSIIAYRLPFFTKMKPEDIKFYGGQSHITQTQGLYIYREKRLIVAGGWMGLNKSASNLTGLCRIQVDVTSSLDDEWSTDVKKSSLQMPSKVKERIKKLLVTPCNSSKRTYTTRGVKQKTNDCWHEIVNEDGVITAFEIDIENPLLKNIVKELDISVAKKLLQYLEQIAITLPMVNIHNLLSVSFKSSQDITPLFDDDLEKIARRLKEHKEKDNMGGENI